MLQKKSKYDDDNNNERIYFHILFILLKLNDETKMIQVL